MHVNNTGGVFSLNSRSPNKNKMSCFFIILICVRSLSTAAFRDFTLNNRVLPNKDFESFSATGWMHCIQACHEKPSCISYNYETLKAKSCYLNHCGFRDRCEALRNLVVSPRAIFHQIKQPSNGTLCPLPTLTDEYPGFIDTSSEESARPEPLIDPAKCPYDKNVSHEDPLYSVTGCSNRRYALKACSHKRPIQLIHVHYVQCTCACKACKTVHVPDACVPRDVFNTISNECEGKPLCRVKLPNTPCNFQYKMAIRITYSCFSGNKN